MAGLAVTIRGSSIHQFLIAPLPVFARFGSDAGLICTSTTQVPLLRLQFPCADAEGCGEQAILDLLMLPLTDVSLVKRAPGGGPAPGDSGGRS